MRSPEELAAALRAQGGKVTPQRQLLFGLLHGNDGHPTAEALFAVASSRMPGISLRTVYQTLTDLAEMGELGIVDVGGAARFDPNVDEHHHVVCDSCGDLRDVHVDGAGALAPVDAPGFDHRRTQIVFRGLCAACTETQP